MKKRPNLLFILTDDQGAWAMRCAGNTDIHTPNLDRLADEGTRFENFFCASPVCSPARFTQSALCWNNPKKQTERREGCNSFRRPVCFGERKQGS